MSPPNEQEKKYTPAEDRLTIDPVTGLRNEHLFRLRLRDEFHEARDRETNAALLAVKLDRLIDINARHGRNGGDEALRALTAILRQVQAAPAHAEHVLFKLAGPVFGYYLPACRADESESVARALAKRVTESELHLERLTVSIGVVNLYEFFTRDEPPEKIAQLIERTVLYRVTLAERKGGNTVCAVSMIPEANLDAASRVLIIDPDPAAVELLARALKTAGMTVESCLNGEIAHTLIQANPPSVIICEAMTPRMNGFMLRDRLQSNALFRDIPFILVSSKKTEDFIRKAVELDIRHFFRKPISVAEVAGLVANLLRSVPS